MAKTLDELRAEYPELTAQMEAEARTAAQSAAAPAAAVPSAPPAPGAGASGGGPDPVQAERRRIQEIDALASLFDTETIQAAKYGDTACTAQEMVYRTAQKAAQQGRSYLAGLEADTQASGAQQVGAAANAPGAPGGEPTTPAQMMAQGRADAKALMKPEKEEK